MRKPTVREQMKQFFDIFDSIEILYEEYAESVGLTYMGLLVLEMIFNTPENCTQKFICEQLRLPKQSVNVIIRSFLDKGYVEMKEIDSDRRNKAIRFTQTGREFAGRVMAKMRNAEEATMEQLTFEQRQAAIILMEKMKEEFSKNIKSD